MLKRLFSYSKPARNNYSKLSDRHLSFFQSLLPSHCILQDSLQGFNKDFLNTFIGNSPLVLKPKTTNQISQILKYCNSQNLAVCPQSGNTGLVGGSTPVYDQIIISMINMNQILSIEPFQGIVKAQAGVILQTLENFCNQHGHIVPYEFGSKSSCMIGANISTCAAGIRLLRYGSQCGNVLGLEAVTAGGEIIDLMDCHRKDNTGYDLKQLFIGSEGTLGIITKAALQLAPLPQNKQLVFLACSSFENVLKLFKKTEKYLGEILSAFQMQDRETLEAVLQVVKGTSDVFSQKYPFYVVIESSGSNREHDISKFEQLLEETMGVEIEDGVLAQDLQQQNELWKLRETAAYAMVAIGHTITYDISLRHQNYYEIVEKIREIMPLGVITYGFGHVGDNNLHLAVTIPKEIKEQVTEEEVQNRLEGFIYEYLKKNEASISAEHGVGLQKREKLWVSRSETEIKYMKALKQAMDPRSILNPYKVLDL